MKILFCLLHEQGHVNPFIGPAQALQAAGHDVVVAANEDLTARLRACGLAFRRDLVPDPAPAPLPSRELVALVSDRARHRALIESVFLAGIARRKEALERLLARERPDAVVVDAMNYPAVLAASALGLPWISMSSSLSMVVPREAGGEVLELVATLAPRRQALFAELGLPGARFNAVDCLSPLLNITFASRELVGAAPEGVALVGPSVPLSQRGDETAPRPLPHGRPLVYASFGSLLSHHPALHEKLVTAADGLGIQLALAVGDLLDDPRFSDEPPHCHYYRYAPQPWLLERASLFITHGGANSVMEALRAGVPMLVHPLCNDQFHQAWFLERSGAGRKVDLADAPVGALRDLLASALADTDLRRATARVARSYQVNGALAAARLVEEATRPLTNRS